MHSPDIQNKPRLVGRAYTAGDLLVQIAQHEVSTEIIKIKAIHKAIMYAVSTFWVLKCDICDFMKLLRVLLSISINIYDS